LDLDPVTVTVLSAKMPFRTRHFNEGQRVWLVQLTRTAAEVAGRYRRQGKFVRAWINWGHDGRPEPDFKPVDVDAAFAGRHGLITRGDTNA
jgi:hypothetical protein